MRLPVEARAYREWRSRPLSGLVDVLWHYDGPSTSRRKRILPNGRVELLVNFGEPYRTVCGAGPQRLVRAWLGGLQVGPTVVEQPIRQSIMGVRLSPAGAHALLGRPLSEVAGLVVDLRDLVGRTGEELADRLQEAASIGKRFRIAAEWVRDQAAHSSGGDPAIVRVRAEIDRSFGAVPIARLREGTHLSKAQLVTAFREQIGLPPKLYARVVRFRHATALLQAGRRPLADLALAAGYYDQPHMNAEFRALAGLSPREILAARYPVGDGLTIAEDVGDRAHWTVAR